MSATSTTRPDEETEPGTPKHRLLLAATLSNELPDRIRPRNITDDHVDLIEDAVENNVLPERVFEHTRGKPVNTDRVRTYVSGFRSAIDKALDEDGSFAYMPIEQLWAHSCELSERISNIDHSGRGSGCCQTEHGLKSSRRATRWIITGSWDH